MGEVAQSLSFNRQGHRVGPVIYGKLFGNLAYSTGLLFGFTDGASDTTLKLNVDYGF